MTSAAVREENFSVRAMKLAGAGAGDFLLGLEPEDVEDLVGETVQHHDGGFEDGGEDQLGAGEGLADGKGQRDGHVLRYQFADQHGEQRGDRHGRHQRDGGGRGFRDADGGQGSFDQGADGRLHDVAGQKGGHGDAQLAAGELGGQRFEALEQRLGRGVAVVDGPLDRGLVKGDQGEFNGYKEAGAEDEQQASPEKDPLHLAACFRGAGGAVPAEALPGGTPGRRMVSGGRSCSLEGSGLACGRRAMGA
jgi:hypothetical protein